MMCVIDATLERLESMKVMGWGQDVRLAVRGLVRKPMFAFVAIVTLGLGIGASTAVFTLVDGVLLSPLDYAEPNDLLALRHTARGGEDQLLMSTGLYLLYAEEARTLESVALYTTTAATIMADGQPERVLGQQVTPSFFSTLGVAASTGRTFTRQESVPGGAEVVLLSDGLWRSRFGGDPDVLGRTIDMSGTGRTVVGVMPPGFGYPDPSARFWMPLRIDETQAPLAAFFAGGIARLSPGSSIEGARGEIDGLLGRLEDLRPGDGAAQFLGEVQIQGDVVPLKSELVGNIASTLWILLGTVGFVLLIACANIANLLLVRAEGRQRELALRVAVGAGRMQVLRSFLAESGVLSLAGGLLGIAIAVAGVRITERILPSSLPRMSEVQIDGSVLLFTALVAATCALLFGLVPMARYGIDNLAGQLRDGGGARGSTGGRDRHRLRNGLVVTQVALALVLLVGSGLMFRSFQALRDVDPGFDPDGVVTARVVIPSGEIADPQETAGFFRQLAQRLEDQSGVTAVGMVTAFPLSGSGSTYGGLAVEDHPRGPEELPIFASLPQMEAGYFEAMGIEIVAGRAIREEDGGDQGRGVVVDRTFADAWWSAGDALGRRVGGGANGEWYTIVGIAEDVREEALTQPSRGTVYFPALTESGGTLQPSRTMDVIVRTTAADPSSLIPVIRREMAAINPRIPLSNPRPARDILDGAMARTSFTLTLLGTASGIALLLGLVGIYGVISYIVSQRTREIGVRMALGANARGVRRMVLRHGLLLSLVGVALGLAASAGLSRLMGSLLFGVSATDPMTYGLVALALIGVASIASLAPAIRASTVDPGTALRLE